MRKFNRIAISISVLGLVWGCGTTTGNYVTQLLIQGTKPGSLSAVRRAITLQSSSVAISVKNKDGTAAGTLTLTDARLALKEIKFKRVETGLSQTEIDGDDEIKLTGPYVVDLLTDTMTPALPNLALAVGSYSSIELKLDKIEGDEKDATGAQLISNSDSLFGKSIFLEGTYTGTTASGLVTDTPFTLSFKIDEELKYTGTNAFPVAAGQNNNIVIAFRLVKWLAFDNLTVNDKGVDFRDVVVSSGRIDLSDASSGNNEKVWQVIRDGVEKSADYGVDKDGNGKLESSEDQDDAADGDS